MSFKAAPKVLNIWAIIVKELLLRTLKSRPIWPHWLGGGMYRILSTYGLLMYGVPAADGTPIFVIFPSHSRLLLAVAAVLQ